MAEFSGFPRSGFKFFSDLKQNNDRDWFTANKSVYVESVVEPAQSFIESLGKKLSEIFPYVQYDTATNGSGSMFRIYRDVRFSKDKSPYKTHLGIVFWFDAGRKKTESPGYYFGMSDGPPQIHGGHYQFGKDHLKAYREYVLDVDRGSELREILGKLEKAGYEVGGSNYKQVPRGYPKDHPNADLFLHDGVMVSSKKIPLRVAQSAQLVETCFQHCLDMAPLLFWLREMEVDAGLAGSR
jgi:uncharacterized protein (TIGR02453 family)